MDQNQTFDFLLGGQKLWGHGQGNAFTSLYVMRSAMRFFASFFWPHLLVKIQIHSHKVLWFGLHDKHRVYFIVSVWFNSFASTI